VTGIVGLVTMALLYSKSQLPEIHIGLSFTAGLINLGISLLFLTLQWWPATIIHLTTGYFLIILSFERNFHENLSALSQRRSWLPFGWLILVLGCGFTTTLISQNIFATYLYSKSADDAHTVMELTENLIQTSSQTISLFSQGNELKALLTDSHSNSEKLLDKAKSFYFSSPSFRRFIISDPTGHILGIYPPLLASDFHPTNLAELPSFQAALSENRTIFSDGPSPAFSDTPVSVVFTSPVTTAGKIIGAISAAVDLTSFENQIQSLDTHNSEGIMLVNSKGLVISDSFRKFTGQLFPQASALEDVKSGQTSHTTSLTPDNKYVLQSFISVPTPKWNVIVQYLYKDVYQNSFLVSFLLFNITVCLGLGALFIQGIFTKSQS
jgi:hypothetical protein